ncbi:UDP-N-acetylmuramoyl-tripeptide--D-alanyl-D-alanine ligase [Paenibacillus sediminis]|nr:UDP-N-acetylmuramoyl-tripeptide--D-alanyl-D-alanine ligase [Paenibacillus sediminis]
MCSGHLVHASDANKRVEGVVTDSRKITEHCLFVPLTGERFDGHEFAAQSLSSGAAASLWQRDHGAPPEGAVIEVEDTLKALQQLAKSYLSECGTQVVGITGSNGKTTTKDIVTSLLATTFKVHKTQGNFNNHIGLPLTILQLDEDTDIAVLEMGMSARHEIELLSSIANPEVAVITNIGESHLLQLGSREEIARAKMEIASGMKPGGLLVYNGDEPLLAKVLAEPDTKLPEGLKRFTFGLNQHNDIYPTGMMFQSSGVIFTSNVGPEGALSLPILGQHNVVNCLAAIAVARHYGVRDEAIREGLEHIDLTGMRIEIITGKSGVTILNDAYNASPTSVKAAIDVLEKMKGYRHKVAVLGDMLELGSQEEAFHEEIGNYLTPAKVDLLFTYGPLARKYAEGAYKHLPAQNIYVFSDKAELITKLQEVIHPRDVVLVKASRGMKLEEVVYALRDEQLQI